MAQVIVDEALLREPNLWVPGKQPLGHVAIDWTNPLTDGLVDMFIPGKKFGVASGIETESIGTAPFTLEAEPRGRRWEGAYGSSDNYIKVPNIVGKTDMVSEITLEALIRVNSFQTTVFPYISGVYSMYATDIWKGPALRFNHDGGVGNYAIPVFLVTVGGVQKNVIGSALSTGTLYHMLGTYKSGQQQLYINGVLVGSVTTVTGNFDNPSATWGQIGSDYPFTPSYNRKLDGSIFYARIWNKWTNSTKAAALAADPYQFLIPA